MSVMRPVSAVLAICCLLALAACGGSGASKSVGLGAGFPRLMSKPAPWRSQEENKCLALGIVKPSPFLVQRASLGGPGSSCGAERPFEMSAALGGRVAMRPTALLQCAMVPAVDKWMGEVVQRAAQRHFGLPVIEIKVAASYACRPINHQRGARLSEHGFANALDVSGFMLADGRWIRVKTGWWGDVRERGFLRDVHRGGCAIFMTVLGPNYDSFHRDHFHFDLAWHGREGDKQICR